MDEEITWRPVKAGQDVLSTYAKKRPLDAVGELVWNGLDAEATSVEVAYAREAMFQEGENAAITRVTVRDNGHGMSRERAESDFLSHGDSWKKTLNGKTVHGTRVLHGRQGRGRFYAYALGWKVVWTTVFEADDGKRYRFRVDGRRDRIDGFEIGHTVETTDPTGTVVEIEVEQGKPLGALSRDDAYVVLSARFAPHLLGNSDITVQVDGATLDPSPLLAAGPTDIELGDLDPADLGEHGVPSVRIIEWKPEYGLPAAQMVLCNAGGAALHEFPTDDKELKAIRKPGVSASAFVLWDGFGTDASDFLNVHMSHPTVVDAALKAFQVHLDARFLAAKGTFIDTLKADGVYPFDSAPTSRVEIAERDLFDLVVMTAEPAISGKSKEQRALSTRLLHLALEERPESVDTILGEVLNLDPQVRDDLADLLTRSSLPSIIRTVNEVTRRIDLLVSLRHYMYATDDTQKMREVDQLHPLVRDNTWLFGEHWHLTRSEASLTNVIKAILADGAGLEEQPELGVVTREDGTTGRVDLLLQRSLRTVHGFRRLVVELKRPSTVLRDEHLTQIKSYARTLAAHPGAKSEHWEFWLVGTGVHKEIEDEVSQKNRAPGHVVEHHNYDVRVAVWGDLIDERLHGLNYIREQLEYDVDQDGALGRIRAEYADVLPSFTDTVPGMNL